MWQRESILSPCTSMATKPVPSTRPPYHPSCHLLLSPRHVDDLQRTMMDSESTARRTLQASAAALNKELAELRASQRNSARQAELQASLAELEASLASPWLNEDPTQAASAMSPYRVSCGVMGGLHRAVGTATVPSWLATTGDVV